MTQTQLANQIKNIHTMGLNELELFKERLSGSMLEDTQRHTLFCEIDKREKAIDKNSPMAEYSEMDFD